MPTKWNKQFQAELNNLFEEGLCHGTTPLGDAYEMSESFKAVTKDTFKRYYYKKRKEFAENADGVGPKIPDSKFLPEGICTLNSRYNTV